MGMLEKLIAKLPSKKFGDMTLYFDENSNYVKLIEHNGEYTYVFTKMENGDVVSYVKTEVLQGLSIDYKVDTQKTWIIPDALGLERAQEVEGSDVADDMAKVLLDKVYQIVNYTILEDPKFKGSNFSGSLIMVVVQNSAGRRYAVPYLIGKDVHGCDKEIKGSIMGEAYRFTPLGSISTDGKFRLL